MPIRVLFLAMVGVVSLTLVGWAQTFFLSTKGYSASVQSIDGQNTSDAVMVGKVERADALEHCERDPGGVTTSYGGKLTVDQCVVEVLKEEADRLYSASADCVRKTITSHYGTYRFIKFAEFEEIVWSDVANGELLDGSSASGAPVVTEQFRTLCPKFAGSR